MAGLPRWYYRNYNVSDETNVEYGRTGDVIASVETIGFTPPSGYGFKEWNSARDGSGVTLPVGEPSFHDGYLYAIWEEASTDYIATSTDLTSVANAIRTKAGLSVTLEFPSDFVSAIAAIPTGITPTGTLSITANDTYDVTNYASASVNVPQGTTPTGTKSISITQNGTTTEDVTNYASAEITVNVSGGGATPVEEKDVNFYDYDGTCLYSYTAAEFANLASLPANPTHTGLTAQGWNWTLADAKTHVATYGVLDIGQAYTTASGNTELDIELDNVRLNPCLSIAVSGSLTIYWGDGTTDSISGSDMTTPIRTSHSYSSEGSYTISLKPLNDSWYSLAGSSSQLLLSSAGQTINYGRAYAASLKRVRLGPNCRFTTYSFYYCTALESITSPTTMTLSTYTFHRCFNLKHITLTDSSSVPNSCFDSCYNLRTVSMPKKLTSVTTNSFYNCYALRRTTVPLSATGNSAFYYCYSLREAITTQTKSSHFSYAGLRKITILVGNSAIGSSAFNTCGELTRVDIPSGITSIGSGAFSYCYGLGEIHFKGATPPAVSSATTFSALPTDCKIYVPAGKLSAYTSASNYPSSSTYTYVEE